MVKPNATEDELIDTLFAKVKKTLRSMRLWYEGIKKDFYQQVKETAEWQEEAAERRFARSHLGRRVATAKAHR